MTEPASPQDDAAGWWWAGMLLGLTLLYSLLAPPGYAQREAGSLTVGAQVGRPSGLTLKLYRGDGIAYEALLTVDGDDFARLSLFRLWERPLPDSLMHVYYGAGALLGGRDLDTGTIPEVGLGTRLGLNFYAHRFEVFLHVTPTLRFNRTLTPVIGGGVGLRYDLFRPDSR